MFKLNDRSPIELIIIAANILSYVWVIACFYFAYLMYVSGSVAEFPKDSIELLTSPIGGFVIALTLFVVFKGFAIIKNAEISLNDFN
ncbi:hypothetical protein F8154_08100 [Alkaliphilus pronyensis]|uniref:Uncharacterized protein n=1 Tax=Alkaliphilus pronyensis TaxID=1482732 RepID=A0A6I0F8H9_9FIRM|nr:hypothetical protein [Alkaliphilus pronyensis]KAB3534814.1 hypothetical protein F8154_08100 [Alkaliphilus pronyensis]